MTHDFVCNIEKLVACYISAKKVYYNFTKHSQKFQAHATIRCTSLGKSFRIFWQNPSKLTARKLNLSKTILLWNFFSNDYNGFQYYFLYLLTEACFSHIRQIYLEFVFIFIKKVLPLAFNIPEMERKKK